jgi:hypothetical protein
MEFIEKIENLQDFEYDDEGYMYMSEAGINRLKDMAWHLRFDLTD